MRLRQIGGSILFLGVCCLLAIFSSRSEAQSVGDCLGIPGPKWAMFKCTMPKGGWWTCPPPKGTCEPLNPPQNQPPCPNPVNAVNSIANLHMGTDCNTVGSGFDTCQMCTANGGKSWVCAEGFYFYDAPSPVAPGCQNPCNLMWIGWYQSDACKVQ